MGSALTAADDSTAQLALQLSKLSRKAGTAWCSKPEQVTGSMLQLQSFIGART